MRLLTALLGLSFFSVQVNAQEWNWVVGAGGASNRDNVWDIATDSQGNVYWAGSVSGPDDFACGQPTTVVNQRGILAKYDSTGTCQWVRTITTPLDDATAFGVAIDAHDRIYICGSAQSTIGFGDGITIPASGSGAHWFVARYAVDGMCLWARRGGGTYSSQAHDIAVDADGTVYVAGDATGEELVFPPFSLPSDELVPQLAVVAYDSTGTALWVHRSQGDMQHAEVWGLSVADGRVFVTGEVLGEGVSFGGVPLSYPSAFFSGLFVLACSTEGDALWGHHLDGGGTHCGLGISADTLGNVFVVGQKEGAMELPDGTTLPAGDGVDMVFLGFGADGTYRWGRTAGTTGFDRVGDVEVDDAGSAYVVFRYVGTIDLLGRTLTGNNSGRVGTAKLRANGNVVWAQASGRATFEDGLAVHHRPAAENKLYFGGSYWGTETFGGTSVSDNGNGDAMLIAGVDTTFDAALVITSTCPGTCTGEGCVVVNGMPPFSVIWNDGSTALQRTDLCEGIYAIEALDALARMSADQGQVRAAADPGLTLHQDLDSLWVEGGTAWQWWRDGAPIPGADEAHLIATASGAYYVVYAAGGCTWNTDTLAVVLSVGLEEPLVAAPVLYPVPATDVLNVRSTERLLGAVAVDALSRRCALVEAGPGRFDVRDLAPGAWMLVVRTAKGQGVARFIKAL